MNIDFAKLLPSIFAGLVWLTDQFSDQIAAFIAGHPKIAVVIAGVMTILANITKGVTKTDAVTVK